jgi:hypothetical protein
MHYLYLWSIWTLKKRLTRWSERSLCIGRSRRTGLFNTSSERLQHLLDLGLEPDFAEFLVKYFSENGTVSEMLGLDARVAELVKGLHSAAWFKLGDLTTFMKTKIGGRQGCKLGGTVFNFIYECALEDVCVKLQDSNISLVLKLADGTPFWSSDDPNADWAMSRDLEAVEVTFVDDEAVVAVSSSPRALDRCIQTIVSACFTSFRMFGLSTHWNNGKPEAMLMYRGKGAAACYQSRLSEDGPYFPVPSGKRLYFVNSYKHLGGIVTIDDNPTQECVARASSAMSAYVPIVGNVFGNSHVSLAHKISFLVSLVLSRLLCNIRT